MSEQYRPIDEQYDTMMEVESNPTGAWLAIQSLHATVIEQQREIERLREALEQAAEQMEDDASLIEHEYGSPVRSLLQLIETGHMPAAYYAARKALGAAQ